MSENTENTSTNQAVYAALSANSQIKVPVDTGRKDFTQLDTAIVEEIKAGNNTFTLLQQSRAATLAQPFVTPLGDVERVIDRRLQALRKKGAIRYSKGVWLDQCSKGGVL